MGTLLVVDPPTLAALTGRYRSAADRRNTNGETRMTLQDIQQATIDHLERGIRPKHLLCGKNAYRNLLIQVSEYLGVYVGTTERVMDLEVVVSTKIDPNHWEVIPEINPRTGT